MFTCQVKANEATMVSDFLPYMKFGQSACMFCISHGIQCRQDRRYIADSTGRAIAEAKAPSHPHHGLLLALLKLQSPCDPPFCDLYLSYGEIRNLLS